MEHDAPFGEPRPATYEMVRHVLAEAGREYGIPAERRILVGFSQSVALNYRFVATLPDEVRGVVGICGGVPGDWAWDSYKQSQRRGVAYRAEAG